MKKTLFFIFIIFISCGGTTKSDIAITSPQNDVEKLNLREKVKSISTEFYEVSPYTGELELATVYSTIIQAYPKTVLSFNEDGYMIGREDYNADNELYLKYTLKLRPDNQLELQVKEGLYLETSTISNWYNNQNLLIKSVEMDGKTIHCQDFYKYNELGKEIERIHEYSRSKNIDRFVSEYNEQGVLIKQIQYNENGKKEQSIEYVYDKKGQLNKEILKDNVGNIKSEISYEYNKDGLEINRTIRRNSNTCTIKNDYNAFNDKISTVINSNEKEVWMFSYTYDKQNNWIKRVTYLNEKKKYEEIREIEYYN